MIVQTNITKPFYATLCMDKPAKLYDAVVQGDTHQRCSDKASAVAEKMLRLGNAKRIFTTIYEVKK